MSCRGSICDDSPSGRLTFQPGPEDVQCRVDVAIVRRPTIITNPRPYSKTCDTFRPRLRKTPASRTDLGTISLTDIDIHGLPSGRFIPQHMSEARPTCIQDGLSHLGLCEFGCAYITDDDKLVFSNDLGGLFVEVVAPSIGDLGVDRGGSTFVAGALGEPERGFVSSIVLKRRNRLAVAQCCQGLRSEIDADRAIPCRKIVGDLTLKGNVPAATGFLHEGAALEVALDLPGLPKAKLTPQVDHSIAVDPCCSRNERHPSERSLGAKACAEAWAAAVLVSGYHELATNSAGGVGMDAEFGRAPRRQPDQIKSGRPTRRATSLPSRFGLALSSHAEVPNLVRSDRMVLKHFARSRVLDPEFESRDHTEFLSENEH